MKEGEWRKEEEEQGEGGRMRGRGGLMLRLIIARESCTPFAREMRWKYYGTYKKYLKF